MDRCELTDGELILRFTEDTDASARDRAFDLLWRRHETFVRERVRKMAPLTPQGYDRGSFLEEVEQRIAEKLFRSLKLYQGRGPFRHFLWKVIESCALDQRRRIMPIRRKEASATELSGEETDDTGTVTLEQLAFKSGHYYGDPSQLVEAKDRKRIVWAVLGIHASEGERQKDSAWAVVKAYVYEWTRAEIGRKLREVSERTVYRLLNENLCRLREIFATQFGITDISQI